MECSVSSRRILQKGKCQDARPPRKGFPMKALVFSKDLHGMKTYSDGEVIVGHVDELYFDDRSWNVRYLVLDIGHRLENRKVLISPVALRGIDVREGRIRTNATAEQIEGSPDASTDLPVARALELQIHRHYGWGVTWPESFMGAHDDSDRHRDGDRGRLGESCGVSCCGIAGFAPSDAVC